MANEQMPDISGMLNQFLQDPAKLAQLQGVLSALGSGGMPLPAAGPTASAQAVDGETAESDAGFGGEGDAGNAGEAEQASASPSAAPLSGPAADVLGGILRDPSVMAQLPAMMAMLRPMLSGGEEARQNEDGEQGQATGKKHKSDHRTALLLALKPYLSDGRREMIDYIVNLSRLGEILNR